MGNIASYQEGYQDGFADAKKKYERPQGEWIEMSDIYGKYFACNNCGYDREKGKTNFCSNCGASMQKKIKDVADELFGKIMSGDFVGHCPTPRKAESE